MPEVVTLLCDICNAGGKTVRRFTITSDDDTREVIVCRDHAAPLRELMAVGATPELPPDPMVNNRGLSEARLLTLHQPS